MQSALLFRVQRSDALARSLKRCNDPFYRWISSNRPPTAPKQYPDVKAISKSPDLYASNAQLRNYQSHVASAHEIQRLSQVISTVTRDALQPRKELKALEKKYAAARAAPATDAANNEHISGLYTEIQELRKAVDEADRSLANAQQRASDLALGLPNLTSTLTPTNGEPRVVKYLNCDAGFPPVPSKGADHSLIGRKLDLLDFDAAATTTGWGFYYLLNEAVLLEQALVQYATSIAMSKGWKAITPPSLVYSHIADSCGFQPRDANDEQQIWQVAQAERDVSKPKRSLAATAEIPLAALKANQAIPEADLPLKHIATSRCYRAEAGARGVDTKGLYRVHEFTKVEMFAWTASPIEHGSEGELLQYSNKVFDEMVDIQCEILTSLGLPCRVLEMPSNDLGASAYRKIDIEAFFPSRTSRDQGWGELTSVSICTDYQSRRLNTRVKDKKGNSNRFAHTLNGTAMAIPRTMACILENGWQEVDQSVTIPPVLRPFMGGMEKICRQK